MKVRRFMEEEYWGKPLPGFGLEKHRVVTLTGMGGTGKTRLSLQVGEGMLESFSDGVWMVELAPLSDQVWYRRQWQPYWAPQKNLTSR